MERDPEILAAACGFGERDLLLLASAGRLSMARTRRYEIRSAAKIEAEPGIYIVDDSLPGQMQWTEMLHRFGNPNAPVLGIGDADRPELLGAFVYRHYRRPILATRLLNALDGLFAPPAAAAPQAAPPVPPPAPRPAAAAPVSGQTLEKLRGKRVLLVTRNQAVSHMLESRLTAIGVTVTCATDVEAAIGLTHGSDYDLILAEPGSKPSAECFSLIRVLKQGMTAQLPVVLISDEIPQSERMRGVLNGVDDFLIKPFTSRQLQELLLTYCV